MAEGFISYGEDGRIVFDSSSMMFGLVSKGTVTVAASGLAGANPYIVPSSVFIGNLPVHESAVLSSSSPLILEASGSGTPKDNINTYAQVPHGSSVTINYWLFSRYAVLPDSNLGLIAYNANGQKCLDLGYAPLRVIAATPVSLTDRNLNQTIYVPGTEGRVLGYLRYGTVERRTEEVVSTNEITGVNTYYREKFAAASAANGFRVVASGDATRNNTPANVSQGGVLICDMTNL